MHYVESHGVTQESYVILTTYKWKSRKTEPLLKALRVAHSEGKKWKKELNKFLVACRSTLHSKR